MASVDAAEILARLNLRDLIDGPTNEALVDHIFIRVPAAARPCAGGLRRQGHHRTLAARVLFGVVAAGIRDEREWVGGYRRR